MPRSQFIATDRAGKDHVRTSESRVYTHTVVALPSFARDMEIAKRDRTTDAEEFDYLAECAAGTHQHVTHIIPASGYHASRSAEFIEAAQAEQRKVNAQRIVDAKDRTNGHTRDSYAAAKRDDRIAYVNERKARGYYETWQNAGWCSRLDLAQKLAAKLKSTVDEVVILEARRG